MLQPLLSTAPPPPCAPTGFALAQPTRSISYAAPLQRGLSRMSEGVSPASGAASARTSYSSGSNAAAFQRANSERCGGHCDGNDLSRLQRISEGTDVCVCVRARACVRVHVRMGVRVCARAWLWACACACRHAWCKRERACVCASTCSMQDAHIIRTLTSSFSAPPTLQLPPWHVLGPR